MTRPSISPAATRVVAVGVLLSSLALFGNYWSAMLTSRTLSALVTNPWAVGLSVAVSAMAVGVAVAAFGVATETFDRNRRGYLRAMRVCGAVGVVAVGVLFLLSVVTAF